MKKNKIYRYLGRNGIVTTPILINGASPIIMYRLIADDGKILTDGERRITSADVFEDEINNWIEVEKPIEE